VAAVYFKQQDSYFSLPGVNDQQINIIPVQRQQPQQLLAVSEKIISNPDYIPKGSIKTVISLPNKKLICQKNSGCIVILLNKPQPRILVIPESNQDLASAKKIFNNPPPKKK
jgi:hypothetical protein